VKLYRPPEKWKPKPYMAKAKRFMVKRLYAALFLDPGLGKTAITLAALSDLMKKGEVSKVLIIAPLNVCYSVWPNEIEKWSNFNHLKITILHGPHKEARLSDNSDIFVINPEGLDWLLDITKEKKPGAKKAKIKVNFRRWAGFRFDTLVVDELTKFKETNTDRFRAVKLVLPSFYRRYGLTGSPVAEGLIRLFGQCYMLDLGAALGKFITHFRQKYFMPSFDGFGWDLQEGAEERIYKKVAPLALRMSAKDYLDLPKLIANPIRLEMPPEAREVYDKLENKLVVKLNEGVIVPKTAGAASMKCRQVASGGVYLDDEIAAMVGGVLAKKAKREWVNLHTTKVDALADLIEELQGSPILVAYDFEHDLDRLRARFGKDLPYIGSGVSAKKAKEIEQAWNRGELPFLFGHPRSMAHGLNLQESGYHICWHTLNPSFELFDQFIRRVYRQGIKAPHVFVHKLIMKDTVDEVIDMALSSKESGQEAFFKALTKYAKGGLAIGEGRDSEDPGRLRFIPEWLSKGNY